MKFVALVIAAIATIAQVTAEPTNAAVEQPALRGLKANKVNCSGLGKGQCYPSTGCVWSGWCHT